MKAELLLLPVVLLLLPPSGRADVFWLSGDVKLEGILVSETASDLEVQVSERGSITLAKEQVQRSELGDEAARAALRSRWRKAAEAQLKEDQDVRDFEAAQRAKGMILYEGDWLTEKEYGRRIEQEKLDLERERLELEEARALQPPLVVNVVSDPAPYYVVTGGAALLRPLSRRHTGPPASRALRRTETRHVVHVGDMYLNLHPPFAWGGGFVPAGSHGSSRH